MDTDNDGQEQQQDEARRRQEEEAERAAIRESQAQNAYNDYYNRRERIAKESMDDSAWLYGAGDRPVHERTNKKETK